MWDCLFSRAVCRYHVWSDLATDRHAIDAQQIPRAIIGLHQRAERPDVAGTLNSCGFNDNLPATSGRISNPYQVAIDAAGGIYIADYSNDRVRYIPATGPNAGILTTIAGGASTTGSEEEFREEAQRLVGGDLP